ncbi:MAG: hypothetical protein ACP5HS_11300 [Anaerolineae bacterium]
MESKSSVRVGLILFILVLAVILVVLLVNLMPLMANADVGRQSAPTARTGVTSQVALTDAEARARVRALEWTEDVKLVRAEAAWYPQQNWREVETPPVAWAFYYYSPGARAVSSIVIDDDDLLWTTPFEIPTPPRAIDGFPPQYDIDVAWISFRAAGGDEFLRGHPSAQVSFRLQPKDGRPLWTVSAFSEGDYFAIQVDAESGAVVLNEQ